MNKQHGNMYPWVTHTWNPIRGCRHDCSYCYVRRLRGYDLTLRLSEKALGENLRTGKTIFVGSTADMFGAWVDPVWIKRVLAKCCQYDNSYLFQTKNPDGYTEFVGLFPRKSILGTTIETNREEPATGYAPSRQRRFLGIAGTQGQRMVSVEPVMDFDVDEFSLWLHQIRPEFVSIGADSGHHGLPEPSPEKLAALITHLREFTEVRLKPNLQRLRGQMEFTAEAQRMDVAGTAK